jgi:membrane protein DedA with SNARE-associated domain
MSFKAVVIACLVSALAGFAVGYYTGGEYMRRIFMRLNRRLTDEEIRKYQEMIYGKETNNG